MRKILFSLMVGLLVIVSTSPLIADGEKYVFFENFEDIKAPDWPPGWTIVNDNGDANQWETWNYGGARGSRSTRYLSHPSNDADDWFFTSAVTLNSGIQYTLKLKDRVTTPALPHNLAVWLGTAATTDSMTLQILSSENITNTDVQETTGSFTVASGNYYIGVHCYSPTNRLALFVDDIIVSQPDTDLELHLQMSKVFYQGDNTYNSSEEIECLVYVKNVSGSSLTVNGLLSVAHRTYPAAVLSFIVVNPNGQTVPFEARGKIPEPRQDDFKLLEPGQMVYKYYNLNGGAFDFTTPGTYTIKAIYKNLHKFNGLTVWCGEIISGPVTIIIQ